MKLFSARTFVLLALGLGIALFVALLLRLDFQQVMTHVSRVGWYFVAACGAYVTGLLLTTGAWRTIIDPAHSSASYGDLTAAFWVGYSVNQLTPTANLGEVYRVAVIKHKVQAQEAVASLILLGFVNMLVVQLFTLGGATFCLFVDDLPTKVVWPVFGVGIAFFLPVLLLYGLLRLGIAEKATRLLARLPLVKFKDPEAIAEKARTIDTRIQRFRKERPQDFWQAALLLLGARILQVTEVFVLLWPLMPESPLERILIISVMTQTVGQLLVWIATFVPSQIGVAEGGSFLLFDLLGLDPLLGFSMAVVRRARWLLAVVVGLIIGLWLGIRPRAAGNTET